MFGRKLSKKRIVITFNIIYIEFALIVLTKNILVIRLCQLRFFCKLLLINGKNLM